VEGGFGDQEPEYDNTFEIVILPGSFYPLCNKLNAKSAVCILI
jgi:hypothetical protein